MECLETTASLQVYSPGRLRTMCTTGCWPFRTVDHTEMQGHVLVTVASQAGDEDCHSRRSSFRGAGHVDGAFDPIGGAHLWHSREALRPGGRLLGYAITTSLRGEGLGSSRTGRRKTAEDQAAHRAAIPSCRGETGAGAAREGRRDRQDRAPAERVWPSNPRLTSNKQ